MQHAKNYGISELEVDIIKEIKRGTLEVLSTYVSIMFNTVYMLFIKSANKGSGYY